MTAKANPPQTTQASRPKTRGFAPRALIDAHFTERPIPNKPRDKKIFELSFPRLIALSGSARALTIKAQATKPITNTGVALFKDFFSLLL
jgi:plasmid replication initiation protein